MSGSFFILAEFVVAFLLHSISAIRILMLLKAKLNSPRDASLFFVALLVNWLVVALLLLPYEAYSVSIWRSQPDILHNGALLFYIAMPAHVFLAMIPVSVFFLTLDRICIIHFGAQGIQARIKLTLKNAYFCSLLLCVLVNLIGFITALPVPAQSVCEIFGCILGQSVQFYLGWRAFCAVFNTFGGAIFFVMLFKTNRNILMNANNSSQFSQFKKTYRANNVLTGITILSEFFLSFIPHFGPFLWEKIFGAGSSMSTGPLSELMSSLEVFLFTALYSHVLSINGDSSSGIVRVEGYQQKATSPNRISPITHPPSQQTHRPQSSYCRQQVDGHTHPPQCAI